MSESRVDIEHIGKTVSFDVYPTATLGTVFSRVKLVAILDAQAANHLINVPVLSANVYPSLPSGTVKDYNTYQFLKVILNDGEPTAVAIPWIDMDTFTVHGDMNVHFTVENAAASDPERIRKILASNGYDSVNYYID